MTARSTKQAILFADVAGSSGLYKTLGDDAAKEAIDYAVTTMIRLSEASGGTLVKTIGDEIMARFPSAENAFHAAVNIQRHFSSSSTDSASPVQAINIRAGASFGDALLDDGDVFGQAVNDAAAVAHIAKARQIIITNPFADQLDTPTRSRCQWFDTTTLKGSQASTELFRVDWEPDHATQQATVVMNQSDLQNLLEGSLELTLGNRCFYISPSDGPFRIGRETKNMSLTITASVASRDHCHIHFHRGKFVLVDHSTNGTYVQTPDNQEIYLRREEIPLTGSGKISVGQPIKDNDDWILHYKI